MLRRFPHVVVRGDRRRCGEQHGEQQRDRIEQGLEIYRERVRRASGLDWHAVLERVRSIWTPMIERHYPDALVEMRGIADGAWTSLEDIVALNARYELLRRHAVAPDDCTIAACLPEATGGPVLLGENWDYHPTVLDTAIVLEAHVDGHAPVLMLSEAGQLGRVGLNARGLGILASGLASTADHPGPGVPVSLLRRQFLESPTYAKGIRAILTAPRHVSNNLLVATAEGDAIDLELAPEDSFELFPVDGLLVHANHFESPGAPPDLGKRAGSSLFRARRVREHLAAERGRIDVQQLKAAFSDHLSFPHAVCRHVEPETPSMTVAFLVFDLTERTFTWCEGNPCEGELRTVGL